MTAQSPDIKVEIQYHSADHQRETATLGMWVFLLTELLLFSGLFVSVLAVRVLYPQSAYAVAQHLKFWIGATNTAVLMVSSFTMTIAIEASRLQLTRTVRRFLGITAGLGLVFICLKSYEYYRDWVEHMMPFFGQRYELSFNAPSHLFLDMYYIITLAHAFHLTVGICLMSLLVHLTGREGFLRRHQKTIEISGLYWHFIDLVWIIVFFTLYLSNR